MTEQKPRYGVDAYLDWVAAEGLKITDDIAVDLFSVETALWPRAGAPAAAVHLTGRGDFANMFVFDIPPGGSTAPSAPPLRGRGLRAGGHRLDPDRIFRRAQKEFRMGPAHLFAIPLNAKHRHFNGSGRERAQIVSTTDLPLVMNTFHDARFVFETTHEFTARTGKNEYFSGEGDLITVRPGNHMWETNFVPDLAAIELKSWGDRGAGGTNIMFVLADGTMHAHISEMPVGTYKKGHRHGPGFHVMCVTGHGFSLLWYAGDKDFRRLDWKHGVVFPPADGQFHQHFNASQFPARYLATGVGGLRYPLTMQQRRSLLGVKPGDIGAVSLDIKAGGDQIEYEDQDKRIHPIWLEEMRKNGVTPRMGKFFPDEGVGAEAAE